MNNFLLLYNRNIREYKVKKASFDLNDPLFVSPKCNSISGHLQSFCYETETGSK